jgi:isocitrate/isopropylmalate dehydrogenase
MATRILVLPGDSIGPEVMASALDVLDEAAKSKNLHLDITEDVLHGAAWNKYKTFCRPETITNAKQSDAVLVGAIGGPEWIGPRIYEPVHGNAPDIAGCGIANPIGMILSVAMMLEFGIGHDQVAQKIHTAVAPSLENGTLTPDLGGTATTKEIAALVISNYRGL